MGVISIIDNMVATHPSRKITHGEMVAALMMYLLSGGRALYRMEQWAQETAILSYMFPQYQPNDWTDDRIADTLEELYKASLEGIQGSISSHIIKRFDIRLDQIHYDTTSVSLWGTYDSSAGQPAVVITFGYSKDHRLDLKQIVMGMAVSGDGGVPIISGSHDGNTRDSVLPISYWERLRKIAGKSSFCFIGDCKVASMETLQKLCTQDGRFLSTMPMTEAEQNRLIQKLNNGQLRLDSVKLEAEEDQRPIYEKRTDRPGNRRKEKESAEEQDQYRVDEESFDIQDNQGRTHRLRKLIIHSKQLACQKAQTRERHLQKAQTQLDDLRKKLNKRKLTTHTAIESAVLGILRDCKVQGLLRFDIEDHVEVLRKKVGRGRPGPNSQYVPQVNVTYDLKVCPNQAAIKEKSMLDGLFLMVSNLGSQQWSASSLLSLYKRQYKVEHVFRVLKTPLAVSPMLLEKPNRICSMMSILTFTLQLYTLIQRQVALNLSLRGYPLGGLMPNKIQTWRPQTETLLAAFDNINSVKIQQNEISSLFITSLSPLQLEILQILDVPVSSYSIDAHNSKET
jgi:transposase